MTRKQRWMILLMVTLVVGAGLMGLASRKASSSGTAAAQTLMPGADADQLWKYITKDSSYKSWKKLPNQATRYVHVDEKPHGDWIALYLNDEAYASIIYPSKPFAMKYGSIIVKENYSLLKGDPNNEPPLNAVPVGLTSLTVMYKVKGYRRVAGEEEWFWVMYGCKNAQCGGVVTISDQAFVDEQIPLSKDKFTFYKGEVMAGKPWLCIECHQRANVASDFSYGDYVWKLKPFAPK